MSQEEKLEKFKKIAEKEEEELKSVVTKRLSEVLESSDVIRYVYIPQLNCKTPYKSLTYENFNEIRKIKDEQELSYMILYHMFHAADETVTLDQVKKLPIDIALDIVKKLPFLPRKE